MATNKSFRKPFTRERAQQEFDYKTITFKRKGVDVNIYDFIQAGREDTEILPTLRKYGNLEPMKTDYKAMYGDFQKLMDLRNVYEIKQKADDLWDQLPAEVKAEFNNDAKEFAENGLEWLNKKIQTAQPTTPTNETNNNEGVDNEQK